MTEEEELEADFDILNNQIEKDIENYDCLTAISVLGHNMLHQAVIQHTLDGRDPMEKLDSIFLLMKEHLEKVKI